MNELQILEIVFNSPGRQIGFIDLANAVLCSGYKEPAAIQIRIRKACADGLLRGNPTGHCVLTITGAGVIRMEELQSQAALQNAEPEEIVAHIEEKPEPKHSVSWGTVWGAVGAFIAAAALAITLLIHYGVI